MNPKVPPHPLPASQLSTVITRDSGWFWGAILHWHSPDSLNALFRSVVKQSSFFLTTVSMNLLPNQNTSLEQGLSWGRGLLNKVCLDEKWILQASVVGYHQVSRIAAKYRNESMLSFFIDQRFMPIYLVFLESNSAKSSSSRVIALVYNRNVFFPEAELCVRSKSEE